MTIYRAGRVAAAMFLISTGFASVMATPAFAGSPSWMPLKGTVTVGCTWNNGCAGGYHTPAAKAIDFLVPNGTAVYAGGTGTVARYGGCGNVASGCNGGAGNYIVVTHSDGRRSRYLHLSGFAVAGGATVRPGVVIGYSGRSGETGGAYHLHYDEKNSAGTKLDPGTMSACHQSTKHSYPASGDWTKVAYGKTLRNDSYSC